MSWGRRHAPINCFGKLPGQGDFLKVVSDPQLFAGLDDWVGTGLGQVSRTTDWKLAYDRALPVRFARAGSRSRSVTMGYLSPSRDASSRRYPFWCAARVEVAQPEGFLARLPLALAPDWDRLEYDHLQLQGAAEPVGAITALASRGVSIDTDPACHDAAFDAFLQVQSLGTIDTQLQRAGHSQVTTRQLMLALGVLLSPVPRRGASGISRGLAVPLVLPGEMQTLLATLWMDLACLFLCREPTEVDVLLAAGASPCLTLGIGPERARILCGVFDPRENERSTVRLNELDWVEDAVNEDAGLRTLARFLEHPDLSLREARSLFRHAFPLS